ncbi:MAG: hypothetical protein FP812_05340 [Desulfobacula sp.]|nr:hypothetical protein [Desulfobacula sp.]MBU3914107.1 hypothetical protein [bacterium]
MHNLINCYASANRNDFPGYNYGGCLITPVDYAATVAMIVNSKRWISAAKPNIVIQDNGGFVLLLREQAGKEILLDDSKPLIYKSIPNPTVYHNVQVARAINPNILIVTDWPVKPLKGKAAQEAEFEKKLPYNIDAANKTIELLSRDSHDMKLYVAFQGYSLNHLKKFFGAIYLDDFDGVSMPIRGQSLEQTALFLLKIWQMGFQNMHLLGVAGLFPMALAAYFARHFFILVTLDGRGWKIRAMHSEYTNPHNLQTVHVGEDVEIDPEVYMDCQCPACRGRSFLYYQNLPYYFRRVQLSTHNFWAIEGLGKQLFTHASSISTLIKFLRGKTTRVKEIGQLKNALSLVESLKDTDLDQLENLLK